MHEILLYYKYTHLDDPQEFKQAQLALCQRLGLKGRIILAPEGINGTVEGLAENTQIYIDELSRDPRFAGTNFKRSAGTGSAFPKLSIKVRPEIVSLHLGELDFNPADFTATHLEPEELHDWIHSGREFYIVDMRNDYEHKVGYFAGSVLPPLKNFRDLPELLPKLAHLKNKTIVTVCTGGVRCEKASGFLLRNGFTDVYQLNNGIVSYMEQYPNEDFKGKLYVFDGRVTMGFNVDSPEHEIVGVCEKCGAKSDNYVDCQYLHCRGTRHFVCCAECFAKNEGYCSEECKVKGGAI